MLVSNTTGLYLGADEIEKLKIEERENPVSMSDEHINTCDQGGLSGTGLWRCGNYGLQGHSKAYDVEEHKSEVEIFRKFI